MRSKVERHSQEAEKTELEKKMEDAKSHGEGD